MEGGQLITWDNLKEAFVSHRVRQQRRQGNLREILYRVYTGGGEVTDKSGLVTSKLRSMCTATSVIAGFQENVRLLGAMGLLAVDARGRRTYSVRLSSRLSDELAAALEREFGQSGSGELETDAPTGPIQSDAATPEEPLTPRPEVSGVGGVDLDQGGAELLVDRLVERLFGIFEHLTLDDVLERVVAVLTRHLQARRRFAELERELRQAHHRAETADQQVLANLEQIQSLLAEAERAREEAEVLRAAYELARDTPVQSRSSHRESGVMVPSQPATTPATVPLPLATTPSRLPTKSTARGWGDLSELDSAVFVAALAHQEPTLNRRIIAQRLNGRGTIGEDEIASAMRRSALTVLKILTSTVPTADLPDPERVLEEAMFRRWNANPAVQCVKWLGHNTNVTPADVDLLRIFSTVVTNESSVPKRLKAEITAAMDRQRGRHGRHEETMPRGLPYSGSRIR